MSAVSEGDEVRTEDYVGPNQDKHRLIVNTYPEVHLGPEALKCMDCVEAKRMARKKDSP